MKHNNSTISTKPEGKVLVQESPELVKNHDYDIILMDRLTPEITFIDEAKRAGVHSYIYKNAGNEHLFYVIRSIINGTFIGETGKTLSDKMILSGIKWYNRNVIE